MNSDTVTTDRLRFQAYAAAKWNAVATVLVFILQLVQLAFMARLLNPAQFGLAAMAMVVLGLAQSLADLGLSNALVHRQTKDPKELTSMYWTALFASALLGVSTYVLAAPVASFFDAEELTKIIRWGALLYPLMALGQPFFALHQQALRFAPVAWGESMGAVVGAVVAIWSGYSGYGAFSIVLGLLALTGMRSSVWIVTGLSRWNPGMGWQWAHVKPHLSFVAYQLGERGIGFLRGQSDKLLIGKLLGAPLLGYYNIAYQIVLRPMMLLNPIITRVAFPVFARIQQDDARIRRGYLEAIEAIAFITIPLYFGLMATAPVLIPLFLGAGWEEAVVPLQVLCLLGMVLSIGNPVGALLLAKGRADWAFGFNILALVVYTGAVVIGKNWGLVGVAWGLVIACVTLLWPVDFWVRFRLIGMRPMEFFRKLAPAFIVGGAMAASVITGAGLLPENESLRLAFMTIFGVVLYAGAMRLLFRGILDRMFRLALSGGQGESDTGG